MSDDPPLSDASTTPAASSAPPTLELPPELVAALEALDRRTTAIEVHEIHREILRAVPDRRVLGMEFRRGAWAEHIAFAFSAHLAPGGDARASYIKLVRSGEKFQGTLVQSPDIEDIDAEVLACWAARARLAKHPSLVARYADLVWELTPEVTKSKRPKGAIDYVRLAIDGYLAASRMDDGTAWGDTRENLGRALQLAMSVSDTSRVDDAVSAFFEYVGRTCDDNKVGTYLYLFDSLLPKSKGPRLDPSKENAIIAMLEAKLAAMTASGEARGFDPYNPREVGMRLAAYYEREGKHEDRVRILRVVAGAFERSAGVGDPLLGLMFLEHARECFVEAGLSDEAARIQVEAERLGPEAVKRMALTSTSVEIPSAGLESYLNAMVSGELNDALLRFVLHFVPDQAAVAARAEESAKEHPIWAMFAKQPVKLGDRHIEADVGDSSGDPDGLMAHRTAEALQLQVPWISWTIERLVKEGLTAEYMLASLEKCPLFESDRMALLREGLRAHFDGSHTQAIHLLIPQIEHAVVGLAPLTGSASAKPHRTGRGVMQSKNLNDMLLKEAWPVSGENGENLRMYLLSALAHPKGLNIRNYVCHGLWPAECFTRQVSERILHVLLTIGLLRVQDCAPSPSDLLSPPAPP